jgi:hypothetical protein
MFATSGVGLHQSDPIKMAPDIGSLEGVVLLELGFVDLDGGVARPLA